MRQAEPDAHASFRTRLASRLLSLHVYYNTHMKALQSMPLAPSPALWQRVGLRMVCQHARHAGHVQAVR